jgi:gamma-glutamyl:cysteine ligase YbdK (ATP-grasp superfamily)
MTHLTIRDVPDDIVDQLRAEAREAGMSLTAFLRIVLREGAERRRWRRDLRAGVSGMRALREEIAEYAEGNVSDSVDIIRGDRARDE